MPRQNPFLRLCAALILTVLSCLTAWTAPRPSPAVARPGETKAYPAMPGLDGRLVDPSSWRGRVTVVNFFASWCGACRLEIPQLVELNRLYAPRGVVVVGLALDPVDDRDLVLDLVTKFGINYQLAFADRTGAEAFGGAPRVPTTLILDRNGKIIFRHVGLISAAQLGRRVERTLKAEPPAQTKSSMLPAGPSETRPMTAALIPRP